MAHIQHFIDRFRYNANRAALVQSRIKKLEKMKPIPAVVQDPTFGFSFPQPEALRPPLVQFNDVAFGYDEKPNLFSGLSFSLDMDSRVAIVWGTNAFCSG